MFKLQTTQTTFPYKSHPPDFPLRVDRKIMWRVASTSGLLFFIRLLLRIWFRLTEKHLFVDPVTTHFSFKLFASSNFQIAAFNVNTNLYKRTYALPDTDTQ